jgi:ATP-dependent Clp protease ATP-binding subunit ClpA
MFDRFTVNARKLMVRARQEALNFKHDYLGTEHMLLGAVASEGSVARVALTRLGIDIPQLRAAVEERVHPGSHDGMGQLPFSRVAKRALEGSLEAAQALGHEHIGTGHVLLGLLLARKGTAATVLTELGVTPDAARPIVLDAMATVASLGDRPPEAGPDSDPGFQFSASLIEAVRIACVGATKRGESPVEPEHLVVAMLEGDGVAARVLRELGATPESLRKRFDELRDS